MKKIFAKGSATNVRQLPDTDSKIVSVITDKKGAEYILTTPPHNGKVWYNVKIEGIKGYVRSDVALLKEETAKTDKYKNVTIKGSTYPDAPYNDEVTITFSKGMLEKYLPASEKVLINDPKGLKLFMNTIAMQEGYDYGEKNFNTNNPGNVGNTDSGATRRFPTLEDGILALRDYVLKVASGKHSAFPLGKRKLIKPYYSKEINDNPKTYGGKSPYLPGYDFIYTGQLDQFVKIYATSPRTGNNYINRFLSYYKNNGIHITPESKVQDIIKLK